MGDKIPGLAVRGTEGLAYFLGPPHNKFDEGFGSDLSPRCRVARFSTDGTFITWCNGTSVFVVTLPECETVMELDLPKTQGLSISPDNKCLAIYEQCVGNKNNPATPNFHIYSIETGKCLRKVILQATADTWEPQWTSNGSICGHIASGEILFYENNNFEKAVTRLKMPGLSNFRISPGDSPPKVAVYVPGTKGAPSFVRLFKYPNFQTGAAIANKSFYKADRAHIIWNKQATAVLVIAVADIDSSGASYYGEQTLHYLGINGEGINITLGKKGPIYSVDWNPNANEFCAVYGFMPAKATLYNSKCEPIFDFGTGPRNCVYFNTHGNIICLAGFGNLRGVMEFWDRKDFKKFCSCQASDSTFFQWAPDGQHFVTATCSPRLREGNGYKIWHCNGTLLYNHPLTEPNELWEVCWRPFPKGTFKEMKVTGKGGQSAVEPPKQVYRPPSARDTPPKEDILHSGRNELPSNQKAATDPQNISKAALKNKKKREAKAKQKQAQQDTSRSSEQKDALMMATHILGHQMPEPEVGVNPEVEKKIKGLKKKLKQIEKLKEQQREGKTLETNQLEKLKTETDLIQELQQLELGS